MPYKLLSTPQERAAALKAFVAEESQAFRQLCISHELTEREVIEQHAPVLSIEMFLFNFSQALPEISGLTGCPSLEQLWLTENEIRQIKGLEGCLNLRCLYLYSNELSSIGGLSHLGKLEVLWLGDNQITGISGLEQLTALQELNLARNQIEVVGSALDVNSSLHTLNLADNRIGSFKQVWHLASLPSLKKLLLSDPDWGACPVACLSNYATYAAVHLPGLHALDSHILTSPTKTTAEATYLRKKMYYNMRIHTLRRKAAALVQQARHGLQVQLGTLQQTLRCLQYHSKACAAELNQIPLPVTESPQKTVQLQQLEQRRQALEQCIADKQAKVAVSEARLAVAVQAAEQVADNMVHRMLVELETGGNIRFEEGRVGSQWVVSCAELLHARWHGAAGLTRSKMPVIQRLARVHNKFLRSRLEATLGELKTAASDSIGRHLLEYMFLAGSPDQLQQLAEEGFPQPPPWPLTNSLSLALQAPAMPGHCTHILVAKVLMTQGCKFSPEGQSAGHLTGTQDKRNWWHIIDNGLILPEYIVQLTCNTDSDKTVGLLNSPGTVLASDLPQVAAPLSAYLDAAEQPDVLSGSAVIQSLVLHMAKQSAAALALDTDATAAVAMPPQLPARPRLYQLSEKAILSATGISMLGLLTQLNLHGSALKRIEGLEVATGLKLLALSFNELSSMEGLGSLTRLTCLDLSFNAISCIQSLKGLSSLRHMDLQSNHLSRVEDLNLLRKYACCLTELDLRDNPMAHAPSYMALTLRRLPHLASLDGHILTRDDWETAAASHGLLTAPVIQQHAFTRLNSIWSNQAETRSTTGTNTADGSWLSTIVEVNLKGQGLRRLQALEQLTALRKACFADNELSLIQGLSACTALQDLSLQGNYISQLEGLSQLPSLRLLDLSRNRVARLAPLSSLTLLQHLNLCSNQITSLIGLSCLASLMELYCGDNLVQGLREVTHLKSLTKLIILDLTGNALAALPEYRLFSVYHLSRLKVLDGTSVEAGEQASSRSQYAGRLTLDTLLERIAPARLESLRDLDLTGMALKDLADVLLKEEHNLSALQSLWLDQNELTEVAGFTSLTSLLLLSMSSNRLGDMATFGLPDLGQLTTTADSPAGSAAITSSVVMFPLLQVLKLNDNSIRSIQSLQLYGYTGLRSLDLHSNKLARIDGLVTLHSLRELILSHNLIKALEPSSFASIPRLRRLDLSHNGLRSLTHLSSLTRLQYLHAGSNRITDVAELDHLTNLVNLTEVWLVDNTVAKRQWYRALLLSKCPYVKEADGQLITSQERSFVETVLMSDGPSQSTATDAVMGLEPQKTIKINQLSFKENDVAGDNIGWAGRPFIASKVKKAEPIAASVRTSSSSISVTASSNAHTAKSGPAAEARPAIWSRLAVANYAKQATSMPESPRGSIKRGAASRQGSRTLPDGAAPLPSSPSIVTVNSNTWDVMARLGASPHHTRRATQ